MSFSSALGQKLAAYRPSNIAGPAYNLLGSSQLLDELDATFPGRAIQYLKNEALVHNHFYLDEKNGGFRGFLMREVFALTADGEDPDIRISGYYNPFREIVDAYQNVFRGRLGREIKIDPHVGGDNGRDVNPNLLPTGKDIVGKIWRWSNLDVRKQAMQEMAANLGTVGLKVNFADNEDPVMRRVFITLDHPKNIIGFDEDDRGNVTDVELMYQAKMGDFAERKWVLVREVLSKDRIYKEVEGEAETDEVNLLGVCPYVILRHQDTDNDMGSWAYRGSEMIVHNLNLIFSNLGESIYEHVWPTWFATAGGEQPESMIVGKHQLVYTQADVDTPPPKLEALVAKLDWKGGLDMAVALIDQLVSRQPELLFAHIKALSGQSGETIGKLQLPGIAAIERAKANYEDAIKRAIQISLSYGVLMDMWDLGSGMGSVDEANQSYISGQEDFDFADRPAMPESLYDQIQREEVNEARDQAKANLADRITGIVSEAEQMRIMGYTPAEITNINSEKMAEFAATQPADPGLPGLGASGPKPPKPVSTARTSAPTKTQARPLPPIRIK